MGNTPITPEGIFYNIDAEKNVLSEIMLAATATEAQRFTKALTPGDFYHEQHRIIFEAMAKLAEQGARPDLVTLAQHMQNEKTLQKVGGSITLTDIQSAQMSTTLIRQHTAIIRELAKKRAVYKAMQAVQSDILNSSMTVEELLNKAKDALQTLPAEYIAQEKEVYSNSYAANYLADFMETAERGEKYNPIPTGWPALDEVIEGGVYPGLYVVGAISSLGKTTFCLQLGDQIAAQGHDVLFISLEMAMDEIMAKSVSRETLLHNWSKWGRNNHKFAKSTRGILTGAKWKSYSENDMDTIMEAFRRYEGYAKHIKIIEGMANVGVKEVREAVEKHIELTGKTPVVILDYLQILAPFNDRATDKQNNDRAVTELKRIARDYNAVVIAISSFNRENYTQPVNMSAYKESGNIEYSVDVAIALQYEGMDYKDGESEKDRQQRIRQLVQDNKAWGKAGSSQKLQIKVLKNRNSPQGDCPIEFWPRYNYFENRRTAPAVQPTKWEDMGESMKM